MLQQVYAQYVAQYMQYFQAAGQMPVFHPNLQSQVYCDIPFKMYFFPERRINKHFGFFTLQFCKASEFEFLLARRTINHFSK